MKKYIVSILLINISTFAIAQNCFWADGSRGINSNSGFSITTDANGNNYATGSFFGDTLFFGNKYVLNTNTSSDIYVVKYNSNGDVIWVKSFGGNLDDEARGITTDANNNIYLTGFFRSDSITFGNSTLYNLVTGYSDVFTVKLDSSGSAVWARSGGNNDEDDMGLSIASDNGGIFITGKFHSSTIDFDGVILNNQDTSGSSFDIFIVKYNLSGNVSWAKSAGGRLDDAGSGITATSNGNIFITGTFPSDSIKFGNITLHNNSPGNNQAFIAKYDSSGLAVWAKESTGSDDIEGFGVATDGNNAYITGEFRSGISFDTIPLQSNGGWYDIFLVEYNSGGNVVWAKRFGGNGQDDIGYGLTSDTTGNLYLTGNFKSDSLIFGNTILYNSNQSLNPSNAFIIKCDNSGNPLWATSAGGNNSGKGIAVKRVDDVYVTGFFSGGSMTLKNVTLANNGQRNIFVAHPYTFSATINTINNHCAGSNNGYAEVILTGGSFPFTYFWSSGDTTFSASHLSAGPKTVSVSDKNNCRLQDSCVIMEPPADSARICLVTVDSASQHNIVMWDKTTFTDVDSFIVYREISTNNFQPIARIPFDSLSAFTDTVRTLYFPNTGDPNVGTYRYKLQCRDTCGGYSVMSPYHNTIFMVNNNGTFSWSQLYTIENDTNPVMSYILMRDDSSNGNWHQVGSVAGTQQTISDPQYPAYQSVASWRVQTQWNIQCTPTRSYSSSFSNLYNAVLLNVKEDMDNSIEIFPNPAQESITILDSRQKIKNLSLYDIRGTILYSSDINEKENSIQLNLTGFAKGIYFLKIVSENGSFMRKIVKE